MPENIPPANFISRADELRKRAAENSQPGMIHSKICPFMSSQNSQCACTPQCKLYRAGKKDYECYFMELQAMSWFLNPKRKY